MKKGIKGQKEIEQGVCGSPWVRWNGDPAHSVYVVALRLVSVYLPPQQLPPLPLLLLPPPPPPECPHVQPPRDVFVYWTIPLPWYPSDETPDCPSGHCMVESNGGYSRSGSSFEIACTRSSAPGTPWSWCEEEEELRGMSVVSQHQVPAQHYSLVLRKNMKVATEAPMTPAVMAKTWKPWLGPWMGARGPWGPKATQ